MTIRNATVESTPQCQLQMSKGIECRCMKIRAKKCGKISVKIFEPPLMGKHQFKSSDSAVLPAKVILESVSSTQVKVQIEDRKSKDDATCTKYRIEWSTSENFDSRTTLHREISDKANSSVTVGDLQPGLKYHFRVATGNCKGYGNYQNSTSISTIPSNWRDFDPYSKPPRYDGRSLNLDKVVAQWMTCNSKYTPIFSSQYYEDTSIVGTDFQHKKKSSIMHRLTTFPKFEKNMSSGSFLSCVVYTESKVLMTIGDVLPIIRIDEDFPTTVQSDFNWFLKVSCKWDDIKTLKNALEKSDSPSSFDFRLKLLQAAESMQDALGEKDLGTLYHKIIRNANNSTIVFSTVFHARTTKRLPLFNFRWVSLNKKNSKSSSCNNIQNLLHDSIEDQIFYDRMTNVPLERGLYLGYLKLASSMNMLQIFVPKKTPNMFPAVKVRNNPHVTGEEWLLIQKLPMNRLLDPKSLRHYGGRSSVEHQTTPTKKEPIYSSDTQELFHFDFSKALQKLFVDLKIDHEECLVHRVYRAEIVQINPDVSIILVFPSFDHLCLRVGENDMLFTRPDFISLPVQVFEINFLSTYQKDFIQRHARLSTILEIEFFLAKHSLREALSFAEIKLSEKKISLITELKDEIESNWRGSRWVFDLITAARSKDSLNSSIKKVKSLKYKTIGHNASSTYGSLKTPKKKEEPMLFPVRSQTPEVLDTRKQKTKPTHDSILPRIKPEFWNSSTNISSSSFQCDSTDIKSYFASNMDARTKMIYSSSPNIIHSQSDPTRSIHFTYSESHYKKDRHENLRLNNTWTENSKLLKSLKDFEPRQPPPASNSSLTSVNEETKLIKVMKIDDSHQFNWFDNNGQSCSKFPVVPDLTESQSRSSEISKPPMEITCTRIVQIYAAYDCGLAEGTFVRLQINNKTTVKEVVQRLIHELSTAAKHKGFPRPYESINDFCLVSVIGARERVLRMDFQLLLLQKPWSMARLYVRKKNEVTAAIIADSIL